MITLAEILRPRNDAPLEEIFRCAVSLGYHYFAYDGAVYEVCASCIYDRTEIRIGGENEPISTADRGSKQLPIRGRRLAA